MRQQGKLENSIINKHSHEMVSLDYYTIRESLWVQRRNIFMPCRAQRATQIESSGRAINLNSLTDTWQVWCRKWTGYKLHKRSAHFRWFESYTKVSVIYWKGSVCLTSTFNAPGTHSPETWEMSTSRNLHEQWKVCRRDKTLAESQ